MLVGPALALPLEDPARLWHDRHISEAITNVQNDIRFI
jgi:hypothetical protein